MSKDQEMGFSYQYSVDLDIARMYNSKGCRHCHGVGYFASKNPIFVDGTRLEGFNETSYAYCRCVMKNVKLYG
jgi:hypothetical protein